MADKKITELSPLTSLAAEDLFVVVDDPGGTPITKKTTAANVFSFVQSTLVGNAVTHTATTLGNTVFQVLVTGGGNVSSNVTTLAAASFTVNANASSQNTLTQYAVLAESKLSGATANATTEHAVAKFTLDVSNSATLTTNTYVHLLYVANTGARVANVQAFIGFGDQSSNSTTAQTKYLFDVGLNGTANVSVSSSGVTNATTLLSTSAATATHKLRIRVNGTDYWLLAANAAS